MGPGLELELDSDWPAEAVDQSLSWGTSPKTDPPNCGDLLSAWAWLGPRVEGSNPKQEMDQEGNTNIVNKIADHLCEKVHTD